MATLIEIRKLEAGYAVRLSVETPEGTQVVDHEIEDIKEVLKMVKEGFKEREPEQGEANEETE